MKPILVLLLLGLCCPALSHAQDYQSKKNKFKTWVFQQSSSYKIKGVLHEVKAGSVVLRLSGSGDDTTGQFMEISVENIQKIHRRRRSGPAIGAGVGFVGGLLTGVIAGFIEGDTEATNAGIFSFPEITAEEKAISYGIFLGIPGCVIGSLLGLIRKSWTIGGDPDTFEACRQELEAYAEVNNAPDL